MRKITHIREGGSKTSKRETVKFTHNDEARAVNKIPYRKNGVGYCARSVRTRTSAVTNAALHNPTNQTTVYHGCRIVVKVCPSWSCGPTDGNKMTETTITYVPTRMIFVKGSCNNPTTRILHNKHDEKKKGTTKLTGKLKTTEQKTPIRFVSKQFVRNSTRILCISTYRARTMWRLNDSSHSQSIATQRWYQSKLVASRDWG